ncbi:MAG: pH regulation protein F [Gammaproteobacteria bacterium]|nr:pH regulation protein F [Gammaproteobacteria bacterium]
MILATTAIALLIAMMMTLIRAILGPSIFDRVLAVNAFGTKIVLFLGVIGFLTERPDFLDIALLYALINFITTLAILRFFESGVLISHEDKEAE